MVLEISEDKIITAVNSYDGVIEIQATAIIFCMGCRERPRGALNIPGSRCAGVYTAGTAQRFVNVEGFMPGKEVVILGSGDIGLIMARRMTLEGAKVKAVVELMPYSSGLKRNIVQCLDDYNIPLLLKHTVIDIKGKDRVEGVTIVAVDDKRDPIKGTEEYIPCDTLLLSVGLIPENELSRKVDIKISDVTGGPEVDESLQTSRNGFFACGNVLHVHDLVDNVSSESSRAGKNAAGYVKGLRFDGYKIPVVATSGIHYTVPSSISPEKAEDAVEIRFRVENEYRDSYISVYFDDERVLHVRKRILTPGEMETVKFSKAMIETHKSSKKIIFKVEES
jgi:NADPH-dependent 2,4-dienoyl-CoA reductase/sulfur reductase-like enzyme